MPFTLTMPKLSPTMEEGSLVKWHKKVGDQVKAGDLLIEVATDKATVEFNAIDPGFLRKVLVEEGNDATVNQPIAVMTETKDESIDGYKPEGVAPKAVETAKEAPKPAQEGVPQPAATPKTAMTQPVFVAEAPLENYTFERPREAIEGRHKASPAARRVAEEQGLDITSVKGSGPDGRVMTRDLQMAQPLGKVSLTHRDLPEEKPGAFDLEKLSQMRKVIAQRLQEAKTYLPHFYVTLTINAEPLEALRDQLRNLDIKLTYNDFIVRACALALREHSNVNSGFDSGNQAIIRFKTIDVCVAVSTPSGLITPIIRHTDYKTVGEISAEVRHLAKRAKEGKLEAHEYKGGSFTISNLGMYGVTDFQAILNPPQAAILAVGGVLEVPVVRAGAVVPGKIMNVTLSADHRVVDGVAAAEFLKTVQKLLENPASLLI